MSVGTHENTKRFKTRQIKVGTTQIGGDVPIVIQSMTTTDTMKVAETVAQAKALAEVGCEVIRITAPTIDDAEALNQIVSQLREHGVQQPIVADIHFLPKAAFVAAEYVDKVRINPGNFADRKMFKVREYTDDQYSEELVRIKEKFIPLINKLKEKGRALRIGTNHGSLSDRIMNRFGDTPEGMIESAFEYAQICRENEFHDFCFSMKSSNVRVMISVYRMLVDRQRECGWNYPIHLGVTEAGDGEDARIKSAIGIGSLLAEGIGDTIRVSLTESPLHEVPVGRAIAKRFPKTSQPIQRSYDLSENSSDSASVPQVILSFKPGSEWVADVLAGPLRPDILMIDLEDWNSQEAKSFLASQRRLLNQPQMKLAVSKEAPTQWQEAADFVEDRDFIFVDGIDELKAMKSLDPKKVWIRWKNDSSLSELERIIEASYQLGTPFVDLGLAGICIDSLASQEALRLSFGILQATRRRMTKTEYIACPSCGRTLFDLEETTARIRAVTNHLKGVKIAIMGCIVNGPGEMADADFGYVGGAPGKVNLYVQKECVERNIASKDAPEKLVDLIKAHGMWVDPEDQVQVKAS